MKYAILIVLSFVAVSCAHHRDVRPGADGIHKIQVSAEDTDSGSRDAISQANHFCEKRGLSAAFLNEDKKYKGDLDEKTYNNAKRASKVAEQVGGAVWVFGKNRDSDVGGIVGMGGAIANDAIGKGYSVEMQFKCM
jgi:hypothetical protein